MTNSQLFTEIAASLTLAYCFMLNHLVQHSEQGKSRRASPVGSITFSSPLEHLSSTSSMAAKYHGQSNLHAVTQSCPSPGISFIHTVQGAAQVSRITDVNSVHGLAKSSCEESMTSTALKDIHMPARLMENFLELARDNTSKDLETCGVLGASLKEGTFYITTLIIPKQESTSSSCQALNEEEIFAIQNELSHFPVGWIHTHPSQSCFMSSVDLHTQYSYQVMVPEAVAIVMAPTDKSRGYGVFRLSDPGGMTILKECPEKGFHTHRELPDGRSIYEHCTNVYSNPYLRLEICDLR